MDGAFEVSGLGNVVKHFGEKENNTALKKMISDLSAIATQETGIDFLETFTAIVEHHLVPYLESPVTYYAAQTDSRDEFESLCNKPERSFLVNFHSKGLAIFS